MHVTMRLRLWLFVAIATLAFVCVSSTRQYPHRLPGEVKSGQEENWKSIVKDARAAQEDGIKGVFHGLGFADRPHAARRGLVQREMERDG